MSDSTEPAPGVPVADVVLPCLGEAGALPWVLGRIPAEWRAIVVDNGSIDGSAEIAHALGARVVTEPRRGFGAACHAGLLAAEADYVCFCDCDGSLDPEALLGLRLTDRRSGYPLQMAVRAADAGWRITERDVPYLLRTGKSKVTGTWRGTCLAIHDMNRVLAEPSAATREQR